MSGLSDELQLYHISYNENTRYGIVVHVCSDM